MVLCIKPQVDFSGGTTGHRAKHQQGTEQVVKAAALPKTKRRVDRPHPSSPSSSNKDVDVATAEEQEGEKWEGVLGSEGWRSDGDLALPVLWDLTAGLGTDSFMLASAGWRVRMFERSPVVAALVQVWHAVANCAMRGEGCCGLLLDGNVFEH